jgi:hypothetical protein
MAKNNTPSRDHEAMLLRQDAHTYQQIADKLGFRNRDGAWKAVQRALRTTRVAATPDEHRQVELARLDELTATLAPLAKQGDLTAVDRLLKISVQRSRLLNLYTSVNAPHHAGAATEPEAGGAQVISMAEAAQRLQAALDTGG